MGPCGRSFLLRGRSLQHVLRDVEVRVDLLHVVVVLEESFVGVDARTALSVGQARGAVLVAAADAGVRCAEYAPARVKQAICGYGRAEKAQMQRMVKMILGLADEPKPHHAADALAVAICHALAPPLLRATG